LGRRWGAAPKRARPTPNEKRFVGGLREEP